MSSEDRTALVALFQSTGGTLWKHNAYWDTDAQLSQWYGVHVNRDGRVKELRLSRNNLKGTLPEAVGALTKLKIVSLEGNKLTGPIPSTLGALKELLYLRLSGNKLTGFIPARLGSLKKLQRLWLNDNQLAGPIPEALGALTELTNLLLSYNKLTGHVPKGLGDLENLRELYLHNNNLTGVLPTELGNLSNLRTFEFGNNPPKSIWRRKQQLAGGPAEGEGLDSWKGRMRLEQKTKPQTLKGDKTEEPAPVPSPSTSPRLIPEQQQTGEGDEKEEDAPVLFGSPNQRQEEVGERIRSPEHASLSLGKTEEVDRLFRAQLSSLAGLDSLIRENPDALEDIQRAINAPAAGSFYFDDELSDMERRRKLGTLVAVSNTLGEIALKHTEYMDIQRKEQTLPPFSNAYYSAVRSGLCQAYLAASAINSDWVSTSKTGGMGKAGAALKLMSSAVPVVGGLPVLVGEALETGDNYLQTRRLVKITAMAPDAVECCSLARRLALRLADGLRNDAKTTDNEAGQFRVHTTAGMNGGSGSDQGADVLRDTMSDEDVFEYVLEEVSSYESNDHGGVRLGKQHLRKLLKAIQRGCLDDARCTEQKIEFLLLEILPDVRPAATLKTPKKVIVRSPPDVAPAHDSGLPSRAEFAAMQAEFEALKSANYRQQAKIDAVESDKAMHQAELQALKSDNKQLRDKMAAMERRVPDGAYESCDWVNAGGGQVLQQKLEIEEDLETFWQRKETAAGAGDQGILTPAEHQAETRDTRARVDDVDDRVDFLEAQLAALNQQQAGKKEGFSQHGRRHR